MSIYNTNFIDVNNFSFKDKENQQCSIQQSIEVNCLKLGLKGKEMIAIPKVTNNQVTVVKWIYDTKETV